MSSVCPSVFLEPEMINWLSGSHPSSSLPSVKGKQAALSKSGASSQAAKSEVKLDSKVDEVADTDLPVILTTDSETSQVQEDDSEAKAPDLILGIAQKTIMLTMTENMRMSLGVNSRKSKIHKDRFVAQLDLDGGRLKTKRKDLQNADSETLPRNYARWKWCLSRLKRLSFTLALPKHASKIPKEVIGVINRSGKLKTADRKSHSYEIKDAWCPFLENLLNDGPKDSLGAENMCNDLADYFGFLSIGAKPSAHRFHSLGIGRSANILVSKISVRVHSSNVTDLVSKSSNSISSAKVCVGVRGCRRAPVSWNKKELGHDGLGGGGSENHYLVVCLPGNVCWILHMLGAKDTAK